MHLSVHVFLEKFKVVGCFGLFMFSLFKGFHFLSAEVSVLMRRLDHLFFSFYFSLFPKIYKFFVLDSLVFDPQSICVIFFLYYL